MLTTFLNEYSVAYSFVIGLVVFGLRQSVERSKPTVKGSFWWDMALYFFPILIGSFGAVAMSRAGSSIVPSAFKSTADQILWGAGCGGLSGFAYTIGKKSYRNFLSKKSGDSDAGSDS